MKKISLFIIFLYLLSFMGCSDHKNKKIPQTDKNQTTQISAKKTIPKEIKLHTINNGDITLIKNHNNIKIKGINNQLILLDFFATWCSPCRAEIPHLINLQKKYKGKLKIVSILLENDKSDSEIKSFIKYNHINYIVTNDKNNYKLSSMLGEIQNIPFMILYDKSGNIITRYLGAIPEEMISSDIKKAIR